jgi:hypothetical protein
MCVADIRSGSWLAVWPSHFPTARLSSDPESHLG